MSDKRESSAMENNHAMVEIGLRNPRPAVLAPTYHGEIGIPGRKGSIPLSGTTIPSNGTSDAPRPGTPCSAIGPEIQTRERWNKPRANTWRLAAIFFAFVVFGMNDASYGALVPYIEADYHLSYLITSLVFLAPFSGYTVAAFFSDRLHRAFGRRGIAIIAPCCKICAYAVISAHPPYPVVVVILGLAGMGCGLLDAAWNAWIGTMDHQNELLGLLHGCYGLGATISPLVVTTMVTKDGVGWWTFYYLMVGLVAVEICVGITAFWTETGTKYRDRNRTDGEEKGMTRIALRQKVTWICSVFFLAYVGTEVSLGGWIVTFMLRIRHGQPFPSGMTATGFWLGITMGRVTLGFITPRIGEGLAVSIYLIVAMGLELIFWLVPRFLVSAVAVSLIGFFIGPMFPAGIVAATKLLPRELHVAAIGFAAAVGGGGAALLPFAVGAIAQARGVQTLQPIVLALLVALLAIWLCLPRIPRHEHQA